MPAAGLDYSDLFQLHLPLVKFNFQATCLLTVSEVIGWGRNFFKLPGWSGNYSGKDPYTPYSETG